MSHKVSNLVDVLQLEGKKAFNLLESFGSRLQLPLTILHHSKFDLSKVIFTFQKRFSHDSQLITAVYFQRNLLSKGLSALDLPCVVFGLM